jgi:hypothetical protein
MKTLKAVAALAVLALVLPAAALAHTGAATVSCTSADFSFQRFAAGSNTVNYRVTVDGATAAEGTYKLDLAGGSEGHLAVALTLHDTHQVQALAWWGPAGVENGETRPAGSPPLANQLVHCPAAPPPPVATPGPAPLAPVAAPTPAPAAINVLADRASSAPTARLAVQAACASRHVRVTVNGRLMRQVRVSVNGRHARTVNVRSGARSITTLVALRRTGARVQMVTTRVSFRNGAHARTMSAPARRCTPVTVVPQFTG